MSKPSGAIDMTQGKPINLMLRFALPMMIGSIFQSLYSMVDSAVLGRFVGSHALAAIGATTSTTGLILLLATGVTSAVSIVLSHTSAQTTPTACARASSPPGGSPFCSALFWVSSAFSPRGRSCSF